MPEPRAVERKTSFGPHGLLREIQTRGPGDYLVVTPTFPLLELKALPELLKLFQRWFALGKYVQSPIRKFEISPDGARRLFGHYSADSPTTIRFGYATDPESLESMTAKAAWCDEAGQKKFKGASWEAILRRLSLSMGRVLLTTTPYDLGWLKQQVYDKWVAGDPDYDVIRFDSTENPQFPKEEFDRARRDLPRWKFDLFYRAIFTRPAGLIYDCFDDTLGKHRIPRIAIPDDWTRNLGLDFGGVNTAGLFFAAEKLEGKDTGRLFGYREYKAGSRSAAEHTKYLLKGEVRTPFTVGGSKSEGQWRQEFRAGGMVDGVRVQGLPILPPLISDVEVGIDRMYGAIKRDEILIMEDLPGILEELATYSRELDDKGEPTEEIEDKATYHYLDASRYIIGYLKKSSQSHTSRRGKAGGAR